MSKFSIGHLVYVDRPPLVTLLTDRMLTNIALLPRAYGSFRVVHITESTPMMDDNGIHNTNSIDPTTVVAESISHSRHCNTFETSLEGNETPRMTNAVQALRKKSSTLLTVKKVYGRQKRFNMETGLCTPICTDSVEGSGMKSPLTEPTKAFDENKSDWIKETGSLFTRQKCRKTSQDDKLDFCVGRDTQEKIQGTWKTETGRKLSSLRLPLSILALCIPVQKKATLSSY